MTAKNMLRRMNFPNIMRHMKKITGIQVGMFSFCFSITETMISLQFLPNNATKQVTKDYFMLLKLVREV